MAYNFIKKNNFIKKYFIFTSILIVPLLIMSCESIGVKKKETYKDNETFEQSDEKFSGDNLIENTSIAHQLDVLQKEIDNLNISINEKDMMIQSLNAKVASTQAMMDSLNNEKGTLIKAKRNLIFILIISIFGNLLLVFFLFKALKTKKVPALMPGKDLSSSKNNVSTSVSKDSNSEHNSKSESVPMSSVSTSDKINSDTKSIKNKISKSSNNSNKKNSGDKDKGKIIKKRTVRKKSSEDL